MSRTSCFFSSSSKFLHRFTHRGCSNISLAGGVGRYPVLKLGFTLLAGSLLSLEAAALQCNYAVTNNWGSGFTGNMTVTNDSASTINGWQVQWQHTGATVTSSWNATVSGSNPYTAGPVSWNATLVPGATQSFGFQGNGSNATATILGCTAAGGNNSSVSSSMSSSMSSSSTSSMTTSSSSSSSNGCAATAITPHVRVDGGSWQQAANATIAAGSGVEFGPHPTSGSWSWSGCGTSGSTRAQTVSPASSCTATATYTNSCGTSTTQAFVVTVETIDATEITLQENAPGFCSVNGSIDTNNGGFTGTGFANSDNTVGSGVEWRVKAAASEYHSLEWRYANASANNRAGRVLVNGVAVATVDFPSTGGWTSWTLATANIALTAGENTIRLEAVSAEGLGNIDSLTVVGSNPQPGTCQVAPDPCGNIGGNALASCNGDPATCLLGGGVGNYRVAMKFDASYRGELEVFAESRRRMFTSPQQSAAAARCVDFLVNVRDPEGEPYQSDRGTAGLNLRITKGASALTGLTYTPVTNPRTLFIAGDSTVADQSPQLHTSAASRYTGWGQFLPSYFGDEIAISNYADSGESTAAFRTDGGGLWNLINARLKSGDWVMIQLGHNDKTTAASLYRSRITNMVTAIRAKGANPILITPMIRNTGDPLSAQHIWGDLNIRNELIRVSSAQNVPLIDLMKLSSEWVAGIGRNPAQAYFVGTDRTHSNEMGAELFAQMIVNEIRQQNLGVIGYLRNP